MLDALVLWTKKLGIHLKTAKILFIFVLISAYGVFFGGIMIQNDLLSALAIMQHNGAI